jgi:hypothetical protein
LEGLIKSEEQKLQNDLQDKLDCAEGWGILANRPNPQEKPATFSDFCFFNT